MLAAGNEAVAALKELRGPERAAYDKLMLYLSKLHEMIDEKFNTLNELFNDVTQQIETLQDRVSLFDEVDGKVEKLQESLTILAKTVDNITKANLDKTAKPNLAVARRTRSGAAAATATNEYTDESQDSSDSDEPPVKRKAVKKTATKLRNNNNDDIYKEMLPNADLLKKKWLYELWLSILQIHGVNVSFVHNYFKLLHFHQTYGHSMVRNYAFSRSLHTWIKNVKVSMKEYEETAAGNTIFHKFPALYDLVFELGIKSVSTDTVMNRFSSDTNKDN